MRAISATAAIAGWLGHARNSLPAALSEENGEFASGMFPAADRTRNGRVGLVHRADRLEDFFAILADIFINWHMHLYDYKYGVITT
jgi:hypothetical protein